MPIGQVNSICSNTQDGLDARYTLLYIPIYLVGRGITVWHLTPWDTHLVTLTKLKGGGTTEELMGGGNASMEC